MTEKLLPVASFTNTRKATHIFEVPTGFFWIRTFSNNAGFRMADCVDTKTLQTVGDIEFDAGIEARNGRAYSAVDSTPISTLFNIPSPLTQEARWDIVRRLGAAAGTISRANPETSVRHSDAAMPDVLQFLDSEGERPFEFQNAKEIYLSIREFIDPKSLEDLLTWYKNEKLFSVCHGEFSMANLLRSDDDRGIKLLTQESFPLAPVGFDAGWFLGDLYEIAMSPIGEFDEIAAIKAAKIFLDEYSAVSQIDLSAIANNLLMSFIMRLIHHYIQFRLSAHSESHEEYFLEAVNDLFSKEVGTFTGELFSFTLEGDQLE